MVFIAGLFNLFKCICNIFAAFMALVGAGLQMRADSQVMVKR